MRAKQNGGLLLKKKTGAAAKQTADCTAESQRTVGWEKRWTVPHMGYQIEKFDKRLEIKCMK